MIKVADEVWIAAVLLHRGNPTRASFSVSELVDRVAAEHLTEVLRPGVQAHAQQHCVANKRPNPGTYRMLYAPAEGGRRLFRLGDDYHPYREGGKTAPAPEDLPDDYRDLLRWYHEVWNATAAPSASTAPAPPPFQATAADRRIGLVSCVKSKLQTSAPGRELYTSSLFRKARKWAETFCNEWYILSAEYGLVAPGRVIAPYERTLKGAPLRDRMSWARRVYSQMEETGLLKEGAGFVWLAGVEYKHALSRLLIAFAQDDPMRGMRIGERLHWLDEQIAQGAA